MSIRAGSGSYYKLGNQIDVSFALFYASFNQITEVGSSFDFRKNFWPVDCDKRPGLLMLLPIRFRFPAFAKDKVCTTNS